MFGKRTTPPPGPLPTLGPIPGAAIPPAADEALGPAEQAMKDTLAEKRAADPMFGVKVGAREVLGWVLRTLTKDGGVHLESALAAIGSLAGFACPASVAASMDALGRTPQQFGLLVVETTDGNSYWFGDLINGPLIEGNASIWNLVHGKARNLGAMGDLPEASEDIAHVSKTIGTDDFGVPRLPAGHTPSDTPLRFVARGWLATGSFRDFYCTTPAEWPMLYGLAAQQLMEQAKGTVPPDVAAKILLECAAPMAKLDPTRLVVPRL